MDLLEKVPANARSQAGSLRYPIELANSAGLCFTLNEHMQAYAFGTMESESSGAVTIWVATMVCPAGS